MLAQRGGVYDATGALRDITVPERDFPFSFSL